MSINRIKPFVLGLVLGALGTVGLGRILEKPRDISISGSLYIVTDSPADSLLNARLYLGGPIALAGPIYLDSTKRIDNNELYPLIDRRVTVTGEVEQRTLTTGELTLWITPKAVTLASPSP